jgi:hypothetical protein
MGSPWNELADKPRMSTQFIVLYTICISPQNQDELVQKIQMNTTLYITQK